MKTLAKALDVLLNELKKRHVSGAFLRSAIGFFRGLIGPISPVALYLLHRMVHTSGLTGAIPEQQ